MLYNFLCTQIKKPRVCAWQGHRQNCVLINTESVMDERTATKVHFRVNVTIPLLEDFIGQLNERYVF